MARPLRVGIIGGVGGGLATARALLMRGMEVVVFEQAARLTEFGGGLVLTPNALTALRALGLEDRALADGFEPTSQVVRSWRSGRVIMRNSFERYRALFGATGATIHRGDMQKLLTECVPESALRLGARCTAVESGHGTAVASFGDGGEFEADIVVGADGIHSAVRTILFGAESPHFTGLMCWRGLADPARLPPGLVLPEQTAWWGPHGHVVHYYVRRGELLNWVAHIETNSWTEKSWSTPGDLPELLATYRHWNDRLGRIFEATERCYKWALYDRDPLKEWSRGRVTLLGDSAHAMLPYLAQGAAQSIEDACVLATVLTHAPDEPEAALRRYEALSLPRTSRIQLGARARTHQSHEFGVVAVQT
jgi:2-polyprenyl-6-methoxyphenol hydroxylase-like FAD-dependent oxidoreductase